MELRGHGREPTSKRQLVVAAGLVAIAVACALSAVPARAAAGDPPGCAVAPAYPRLGQRVTICLRATNVDGSTPELVGPLPSVDGLSWLGPAAAPACFDLVALRPGAHRLAPLRFTAGGQAYGCDLALEVAPPFDPAAPPAPAPDALPPPVTRLRWEWALSATLLASGVLVALRRRRQAPAPDQAVAALRAELAALRVELDALASQAESGGPEPAGAKGPSRDLAARAAAAQAARALAVRYFQTARRLAALLGGLRPAQPSAGQLAGAVPRQAAWTIEGERLCYRAGADLGALGRWAARVEAALAAGVPPAPAARGASPSHPPAGQG